MLVIAKPCCICKKQPQSQPDTLSAEIVLCPSKHLVQIQVQLNGVKQVAFGKMALRLALLDAKRQDEDAARNKLEY